MSFIDAREKQTTTNCKYAKGGNKGEKLQRNSWIGIGGFRTTGNEHASKLTNYTSARGSRTVMRAIHKDVNLSSTACTQNGTPFCWQETTVCGMGATSRNVSSAMPMFVSLFISAAEKESDRRKESTSQQERT